MLNRIILLNNMALNFNCLAPENCSIHSSICVHSMRVHDDDESFKRCWILHLYSHTVFVNGPMKNQNPIVVCDCFRWMLVQAQQQQQQKRQNGPWNCSLRRTAHVCIAVISDERREKNACQTIYIRTLNDRHTRTESHDATAVNQLIAYPIPDIGARAFCIRSMFCLCAMASHVCIHDIVYYCHTISKRTLCGRCWVHHDKTNILHSRFRFDLFGLHWFDSVCLFCLLYSLLFNQLLDLRHSKVSKFRSFYVSFSFTKPKIKKRKFS